MIIGGVAAGAGDQNLALVILAGALGAFLGDNTAYLIGRRFAPWFERRAEQREKTAKRLDWAHDQIRERGGLLLITARFIPGGRTALDALVRDHRAAAGAGSPGGSPSPPSSGPPTRPVLGYIFGQQFEDNHTLAFVLAFAARPDGHGHRRGRRATSGTSDARPPARRS